LFQENASLEMVEEEQKKILKHEALQLLKKKEKADNIIKVSPNLHKKSLFMALMNLDVLSVD
jgi:upstream-binding transcription factor